MAEKNRNDRRRQTSRTAVVKNKSKKKIDKVTIIGFVVLLAVLGGLFLGYQLQQMEKQKAADLTQQILAGAFPEGTIASVGDLKIETSAFAIKYFSNKLQKEQEKNLTDPAAINTFWRTGTIESTAANQGSMEWLKTTSLEQSRQFVLYQKFIQKQGFKLTEADNKAFETKFTSDLETNFGKGADVKSILNRMFHVSLEDYKKYEQNSYMIQKYQELKLAEETKAVTDKQASDYYKKNKKDYTNKYIVQHILFLTKDPNTNKAYTKSQIAAAEKKAKSVLAEVNKPGADMVALVQKYSEDTGKTQNNGIYDVPKTDTQLDPVFRKWALGHKVGDTGIIKTSFGFHIMKQLVSGTNPYSNAKSSIVSTLAQTKLNDLLQKDFAAAPAAQLDNDVYAMVANVLLAAS